MKRFILSLSAAAVLSMPMAASALDKMDNNQLKSATGQAGVSIAVDDVVIYQSSLADTTYWDTDGMDDGFGAAGVMIDHAEHMEKLMVIDGILTDQYADETYSVSNLSDTFGTKNVGIISQDDLSDLKTSLSDFQSEYLDDNSDEATTYAENSAIIDEGIGGDNDYDQDDIDDAQDEVDTIEASIEEAYGTGYNLDDDVAGFDATNGNTDNNDYRTGISPLTIDVGTCEALTAGWKYNMGADDLTEIGAVGGVVIGLPTIEIKTYNTTNFKSVKLATGEALADGTIDSSGSGDYMNADHNEFITIEKTGESTLAILGGRLEIAPH